MENENNQGFDVENQITRELATLEKVTETETFRAAFTREQARKRGKAKGKKAAREFFAVLTHVDRPDPSVDARGYLASYGVDLSKIDLGE